VRAASPDTADALAKLAKKRHKQSPTRGQSVAHLPVDLESRLELAKVEPDVQLQVQPIWSAEVKRALTQIVAERENGEALAKADLHPARSLLFVGPPGVGKTLSARWLASQLRIPLVTLDLAAVMSSFLGRTGNNLRNLLDYAKGISCILLLDEFDAIAKRRDDAIEVGELKRLVTVLLQEIDQWPSSGILIAATNHPELLDPAIWRRFDSVVGFDLPDDRHLRSALTQLLGGETEDLREALVTVMTGMSFSDVEREILRAKREAVLSQTPLLTALEGFIRTSLSKQPLAHRKAAAMKLLRLGYSQRHAHDLTGVSRDTMRTESLAGEPEDDDA
jgi:SpoVK/Ycf46/Vps4 family AAA+-type ATPase